MFLYVPHKDLRAIIMETLKGTELSISGITRQLKSKGHDYHRLMVTGYLKAMADIGLIREKTIPPSKVYSLHPHKSKDIYGLMGELVKARNLGFRKESLLCAQVLETLFTRPIFLSEMNLCGYEEPSGVKKVSGDDRSEARDLMSSAGLKVGPRELAFTCRRPFMDDVQEVVIDLLIEVSGTKALRKGTTQTTLDI